MSNFNETEIGFIPSHWGVSSILNEAEVVTDYVANGSFASLKENVTYKSTVDYAILVRMVDFSRGFKGDLVYVDEKSYKFLKKSKLLGGEIIISNVGEYAGTVFRVPALKSPMTLGPNSIMVKFKEGNDFYYYFFKSSAGQELIQSIRTGSAIPKFNKTDFRNLKIPVLPLWEKDGIAEILSSLDDKIDLLHRNNKTLEQLSETLFRQWFVEEAETDWEKKSLDQIAEYLNGLALQKFPAEKGQPSLPAIKIREMNQGITEVTDRVSCNLPQKYIIENGDILFSWSGSLDVIIWTGGKGALNQHLFKVSSNIYPKWLIYFATRLFLPEFRDIANDKATTMGHIQRGHLTQSTLKIPDIETIIKYDKMISEPFNKIINNHLQIQQLETLRDTLLPKLMSGLVRVEN